MEEKKRKKKKKKKKVMEGLYIVRIKIKMNNISSESTPASTLSIQQFSKTSKTKDEK